MARMRKTHAQNVQAQPAPDELTALAEACRLAASVGTVPEALRSQLGVLHDLSRARTSYVALHDSARGLLTVVATRGRADEGVRAQSLTEGPLGQAFREQTVVTSDAGFAIGFAREGQPAGAAEVLGIKSRPSDAALSALAASMGAALAVAQGQEELRQRKGELEQLSAQMKQLDRQRDEFLGRVSHELKTPLTTVKTYLSMLTRHRMGELRPEQERALAIVDRNSDRLLRLIDDLLLVSRLRVGQMTLADKPFGLKAMLEECWAVCQKVAARAEVRLEPVSGGEYFVRGDREHLRESMLALLDNAIRYNRAGGSVTGRVSGAGAIARLEIADTGRGIPQERMAALFEPFDPSSDIGVRRKDGGGTLARVSQVVQLHGGSLSVQSAGEQGTTFTVSLPLFAGMVTAADVHPVQSGQRGGVLMVEDDDDCREGVQELLKAEGIDVAAVASSREAITALQTLRPALVLVDLRLREGDGRDVIAHVRATPHLASLPVFVMSGAVGEASSFKSEGPDRIDGFFEKPLNLPRVLSEIRRVVQAGKTA